MVAPNLEPLLSLCCDPTLLPKKKVICLCPKCLSGKGVELKEYHATIRAVPTMSKMLILGLAKMICKGPVGKGCPGAHARWQGLSSLDNTPCGLRSPMVGLRQPLCRQQRRSGPARCPRRQLQRPRCRQQRLSSQGSTPCGLRSPMAGLRQKAPGRLGRPLPCWPSSSGNGPLLQKAACSQQRVPSGASSSLLLACDPMLSRTGTWGMLPINGSRRRLAPRRLRRPCWGLWTLGRATALLQLQWCRAHFCQASFGMASLCLMHLFPQVQCSMRT